MIGVKVCGLATVAGARAAARAGADRLGVVLAPSPRRVAPDRARALVAAVPGTWVGVFVDSPPEAVAEAADRIGLAAVQLHGAESPDRVAATRAACGRPVWKAAAWDADPALLAEWAAAADALLVDAARPGSGRPFPWEALAERLPARPRELWIGGGLDAGNVGRAIAEARPDGVDASSRLERAPGRKDPARVRAFVDAARAAAAVGVA